MGYGGHLAAANGGTFDSAVPLWYTFNLVGGQLLWAVFSIDQFRDLLEYEAPLCGEDVFAVLDKFKTVLYPQEYHMDKLSCQLQLIKLRQELLTAVSCLTSMPAQFVPWDTYTSPQEMKLLKDGIHDVLDLVSLRNKDYM